MLYDVDDDKKEIMIIEVNNTRLTKKMIICGIIIVCCFFVMGISLRILYKNKDDSQQVVAEKKEATIEEKDNLAKQENNKYHIQIPKHNLEQIKLKFVPKENPNAQDEITNIYSSNEKIAYLTFDDGPSKNITPEILDILKEEQVPATFFLLGSRVELNPDLVKREFEEGHYLANHGYSHQYSQIYSSTDSVLDEYNKCEEAIKDALDNPEYNTYLFRFPGGSSGGRYADLKAEAKDVLHDNGINHTNWNCLTGDAEGKTTPDELMDCLKQTMEGDGSLIVLMHDASDKSYTAETLPQVISYLREQGYTFKNFYGIF